MSNEIKRLKVSIDTTKLDRLNALLAEAKVLSADLSLTWSIQVLREEDDVEADNV